ncbi:enoyl-CoA hydratase/isomerase family protein [Sphingobacterium sp. MYb382]|uniref:enoyl-CoA hydratase/isomerase family protein n=1 Tax=Sphingobacterium sp. MYb382 TaxID=2745278 RepID=UPI0030AFF706
MKTYHNILVSISGKTALITMNRPEKLNALNKDTLEELASVLAELKTVDSIRGLILTGAGAKAFVAGADIAEFQHLEESEGKTLAAWGQHQVMDVLHAYPKPVVAAINGFALGGGLELAMACHIRVAVEQAKMGLPEVSLGLIPGYGGTQRLPELVGRGKAMEMILTGDMIGAPEALQWGLVNHVVPEAELLPKAAALLDKIYSRSSQAITAGITAINAASSKNVDGYAEEQDAFGRAFSTSDFKEGVAAFLEKRPPNFS